jgi:hypothetical protein
MDFIKLFEEYSVEKLEEKVNDWLEEHSEVVVRKIQIQPVQHITSHGMSAAFHSTEMGYMAKIDYVGKRVK